jgi:hypothetical protein
MVAAAAVFYEKNPKLTTVVDPSAASPAQEQMK